MRTLPIFCLLALGGFHIFSVAAELSREAHADTDACVDVAVNGQHSQSFACLTQKLQPAASPQAAGSGKMMTTSEEIAQRPSNQIGLFNYSATSHRMGNNFGVSVLPQRPPPQPLPPPITLPH